MSGRLRSLLVLLTVLALLAVPGAALAAKTGTKVEPASTWIGVELPSRGGWQISVLTASNGKSRTPVSISANDSASHASLTYGVHGRWTKDGTIVAKFPGIGRVNLHFDQAEVKKEADRAEPGCTVGGETLVRKGAFRGRIKLDDPKGFGKLNLGGAPGTITDFPAETCPVRKGGASKHGAANVTGEEELVESAGPLSRSFHSGRKLDGGELTFDVETYPSGFFGEKGGPRFEFTASFYKMRHGLSTFASATTPVTTKGFDVPPGAERRSRRPGHSAAAPPTSWNRQRRRAGRATSTSSSPRSARSA